MKECAHPFKDACSDCFGVSPSTTGEAEITTAGMLALRLLLSILSARPQRPAEACPLTHPLVVGVDFRTGSCLLTSDVVVLKTATGRAGTQGQRAKEGERRGVNGKRVEGTMGWTFTMCSRV